MNIEIRDAVEEDSSALSSLVTELGYRTTPLQMSLRLKTIAKQPGYKTLVAEAGGTIVGMVGASIGYYYEHDGSYLRVLAMVTTARARTKGIATALLTAIEEWGKQQGASAVFLNSGNRKEREAAHAFYGKRGFAAKSTGFVKKLR